MPLTSIDHLSRRSLVACLGSIAIALGVGAIGGIATASSVSSWYAGLNKPTFNPPNAVFAPVWTTLYVLMAICAWRVWRTEPRPGRTVALTAYGVQLALNLAWSLIFFGLRAPGLALAEIVVLLAAVTVCAARFWAIDRLAGLLMGPYLGWVAFASALNFEI